MTPICGAVSGVAHFSRVEAGGSSRHGVVLALTRRHSITRAACRPGRGITRDTHPLFAPSSGRDTRLSRRLRARAAAVVAGTASHRDRTLGLHLALEPRLAGNCDAGVATPSGTLPIGSASSRGFRRQHTATS